LRVEPFRSFPKTRWLLLFGPAFLAAHHTYLKPLCPEPCEIGLPNPTHPSFAVRHKMLTQVMRSEGWGAPITAAADGPYNSAEIHCLNSLTQDPYSAWAQFFSDAEVAAAVVGVRKLFQPHPWMGYVPSTKQELVSLLQRLVRGNPPILATVSNDGAPELTHSRISQILYAGWVYWIGQQQLAGLPGFASLDFLSTNLLCDRALLQQRAIDISLKAGVP
jgi:hypothetical protein